MSSSSETRKRPNLDSVTTINPDGSRYFLHPADVHGKFTFWRRVVAYLLLAIYIALPWIQIDGYPAVFLDVIQRRFHFFGLTFAAQDAWLLFFGITGLAFTLFYVTAIFGRIWCGWICPYTVFMEHVYRRVERFIEGDGPARRKLDRAPMSGAKAFKRITKHVTYILVSLLLAHMFLAYFVSIPGLYDMMQQSPTAHARSFGIVIFLTVCLYGAFSWFREQFCIILCPYGRFQSALTDEHTTTIGYDEMRGEPRGKARNPDYGDCIDCNRCVQVCPTGIDIRNGLQLECIGCAACIDACDNIMAKLNRPKGLIRYDSLKGLQGEKTRLIRPRTMIYSALLAVGLAVMVSVVLTLTPLNANLIRIPGPTYIETPEAIRNNYRVRVINKQHDTAAFRFAITDAPDSVTIIGGDVIREMQPLGEELFTIVVEQPKADYTGNFEFRVVVETEAGEELTHCKGSFAGPSARFLRPTNPEPEAPPQS